jgi:hypothetical protein
VDGGIVARYFRDIAEFVARASRNPLPAPIDHKGTSEVHVKYAVELFALAGGRFCFLKHVSQELRPSDGATFMTDRGVKDVCVTSQ